MKLVIKLFVILGILVSFNSCTKDEGETIFIDSELKPYFDRFAEEGSERGIIVDFVASRIEGYIEDVTQNNVVGQCEQNSIDPDRLIMDRQFWKIASDQDKEFLVFHELGHCFLGRGHLDTNDMSGNCVSIMHSGSSGCHNIYNASTRESYLDELFEN